MTTPARQIADATAKIDSLVEACTVASRDLRRVHTAAQDALQHALADLARIRRELRELDADLTPVQAASGTFPGAGRGGPR